MFGEVLADEDRDEDGELGGKFGVRETTGMAFLCACIISCDLLAD